jgi:hypothetical protein
VVAKLRCNKRATRLPKYVVGEREQRRRDRETNRLVDRQIDDEIELGMARIAISKLRT